MEGLYSPWVNRRDGVGDLNERGRHELCCAWEVSHLSGKRVVRARLGCSINEMGAYFTDTNTR